MIKKYYMNKYIIYMNNRKMLNKTDKTTKTDIEPKRRPPAKSSVTRLHKKFILYVVLLGRVVTRKLCPSWRTFLESGLACTARPRLGFSFFRSTRTESQMLCARSNPSGN